MYKPLAKIILQWTIENECKLLISASGTPLQQIEEKDKKILDPPLHAAGSTKKGFKTSRCRNPTAFQWIYPWNSSVIIELGGMDKPGRNCLAR
jgi:hypothetical protein